ncbi:MAG: TCR/Tet family MFS transporter [Chloroflexi bacterium]|nr:MAG: TCR/Tet family MFS transporter [Chloroflexota bacterium]
MALTILIDFTGFGLIIPLQPFWAQHLGANAQEIGFLVMIYALAQFIFTPLLGSLSDRYGRKPIIVVSLLVEAVSLVLTALATSLPLLLLARLIGGLGASNIGSAQAVVSDVTMPNERAKGMGLIGAAIGLGFVIGPALGGLLSPLGATVPFWLASGIALLNTILVLLFLPETRQQHQAAAHPKGLSALVSGWENLRHTPALLALIIVNLLYTIAFTAMETTFPLFTQHAFGWGASQNGYIFTYVGILVVIMQGGLVARLVKRWGEKSVLLIGLVLMAVGLSTLAFSTQLIWIFVTLGLLSIGDGAITPTVSTLLSFTGSAETQGKTLGLAQGIGSLGRIIGPYLAGSVYLLGGPTTPLLGGSILVALGAVQALPALSRMRKIE